MEQIEPQYDNHNLPYRDTSLKDRPGEVWAPVPRLELYFHISNHGRVKRLARKVDSLNVWPYLVKERIMLPAINKRYNSHINNYFYAFQLETVVDGKHCSFQLHRMVYYCFVEAFDLDDPDIKITAEGSGLDIRPEKLIRINARQQAHRMYDTGRQISPFSFEEYDKEQRQSPTGKAAIKNVSQYNADGKLVHTYQSITEAAALSKVSVKDIRHAAKWLVSMSKGYYWRYGNLPSLDVKRIKAIMARDDVHNKEDAYRRYIQPEQSQ